MIDNLVDRHILGWLIFPRIHQVLVYNYICKPNIKTIQPLNIYLSKERMLASSLDLLIILIYSVQRNTCVTCLRRPAH